MTNNLVSKISGDKIKAQYHRVFGKKLGIKMRIKILVTIKYYILKEYKNM